MNNPPEKIKHSGKDNGGNPIKRQTNKSKIGNCTQKQAEKKYKIMQIVLLNVFL